MPREGMPGTGMLRERGREGLGAGRGAEGMGARRKPSGQGAWKKLQGWAEGSVGLRDRAVRGVRGGRGMGMRVCGLCEW